MSFAKDRGMIATNPCEKCGKLYAADRTDKVWGEQEIAALLAVALTRLSSCWCWSFGPDNGRAICCGCPGRLMTAAMYDFGSPRQVGASPCPSERRLRCCWMAPNGRSPLILTNSCGRAWTSDEFRTSWSKACARAGVTGLTFHDLRGSAVVRLVLAEATVPQIATFTGHSLKDVEAILDAHYLGRDIQLAEAAVLKLEKRTKL